MIELTKGIRDVEMSLGSFERNIFTSELNARKMIRRSIVAKKDLKKGHNIQLGDIKFARPGTGISTNEYKYIEGRKLKIDVSAECILEWDMFL